MTEVEDLRWWRAGMAMMNYRFFDKVPDIEKLDVEYLRATMLEEMSLVEEHGWPLETIESLLTERTMTSVYRGGDPFGSRRSCRSGNNTAAGRGRNPLRDNSLGHVQRLLLDAAGRGPGARAHWG